MPRPNIQPASNLVNIAANGLNLPQGTQAKASFSTTIGGDNVTHGIDGSIFRREIQDPALNVRWTTYSSPHASDWYSIDLRRAQAISEIHVYFYDDDGGVRVPTSYDLQYLLADTSNATETWSTIPDQRREGTLSNNARVRVTFPQITASQIRIMASNRGNGTGWGLSELQVWTRPIFLIQNVGSGNVIDVANDSTSLQLSAESSSKSQLWEMLPAPGGWTKIKNISSDKLMMAAEGGVVIQSEDVGDVSQLWRVQDTSGNGQFLIRNKKSDLVVGVDGTMVVEEAPGNESTGQLWDLLASVPGT